MNVTALDISGLKLLELKIFSDHRGFFTERFNRREFEKHGLPTTFVQDNHSHSLPGVVRGLHFQTNPPQGKLVGVIRGRVWDVAVDIRPGSPTFGKHFGVELSAKNGRVLWIPGGFAHGFCVLGDEPADMFYKVDQLYDAASDGGILWSDSELKLPWPLEGRAPIISEKDTRLPTFAQYRANPPKWPDHVLRSAQA